MTLWQPLLVLTLVWGSAGQRPPAATAELVHVGATLETTSGVPVLEIDCATFELRVDDRPRPLRGCVNGAPVTIALLLDVSSSFEYQSSIPSLVDELAAGLRPEDRLGVGWFAAEIAPPATFTRDRQALSAAAERAADAADDVAGPSPLWDALTATIEALPAEPGRRAVVVVTDGRATGNQAPFAVAARGVVLAGVEVHVIGRPFIRAAPDRMAPEIELANRPAMLALASGGTASGVGQGFQDVKPRLRAILAGLQRSYTLSFAPDPRDNEIHRLDVRVHARGVVIRAPDRFGVR
jgi:hypothetical protein